MSNIYTDSTTGHTYEVVLGNYTWSQALTGASAKSYQGLSGHLATITSASEQKQLQSYLASSGLSMQGLWLGGSDADVEGSWKWFSGPEGGTQFWSGTATGSAVSGRYSNWDSAANPPQPNTDGNAATEDYLWVTVDAGWNNLTRYKWGDAPGSTQSAYLVEYSPPQSITVIVSPTSLSESGSTNLTYTFTRSGDTSSALTVNIDLAGTAGSADYTVGPSAWTKLLGTSGGDYARILTTGLDGSIYASGFTFGGLDGNTNSGYNDAFLTKYNVDGTKAWTKLLGTSNYDGAHALTTGLDGSIYVSGQTYGALDGQTNSGSGDAFLTKYSADGNKAWTNLLGTSGEDLAHALTTGLDGSIYVGGKTYGALDGQTNIGGADTFLTKYSTDGTKAWTKLLGSSGNDETLALTTGLDGSIYASGKTYGALDGQTNSGGGSDAFLIKYSADGTKAWTKLLGTGSMDESWALTTGLDGSIYVSGRTAGALDGQTNSGGYDAFLTKYSTDGTKAWTKLLGTSGDDFANALTTGLDGSIYVSGHTTGSLDGQINSGNGDAFLTKYSTDGTKAWTKLLGSSGTDQAFGLTTGLDGSIYVSGDTSGALDGQTNSGNGDGFLTKFYTSPPITFAAGASTATLVLDPTADSVLEGNETVVVTILAGTGYTLGSTFSATGTIDDTPPTLAITSSASALKAGETATIAFSFSEAPTGFVASDITTTGGTLGTPTVSSTDTKVYTATFTPTASLASGSASITVASSLYTDAAGNSGGAGTTPTISIDTLAPTVATFSPSDEATGAAVDANIVLTFSEAIALGTGNIVLKTAAGVTVATYSAATSSNLSISGSTLTINPTADLGYSTAYKVEFAAGTIKDLVSNSYAGTTSYNFTTAATSSVNTPEIKGNIFGVPYYDWYQPSSYVDTKGVSYKVSGSDPIIGYIQDGTVGGIVLPAGVRLSSSGGSAGNRDTNSFTFDESNRTLSLKSKADFNNPSDFFLYEIKESTPYIYSLEKDNIYIVNLYNAEGGFGFAGVIKVVSSSGVTSVVVPTYTVSSSVSSVDEGGTVTFTVNTQNLATGSALAYSLSGTGISSGDVDGGLLSGTLKTDATGKASLAVSLLADKATEGDETLNFVVAGQTASVKVKDTSTATVSAQPGVLFTDATNLSTSEAGGRAQFKVALASAPRYDVTVTLTSNDQTEGLFVNASASGVQTTSATKVLTFTASNWSQAQTVSLIGVDDSETDGDVAYVISTKVSSSDLNYDGMRAGQGLVVANLFVTNVDDDKPDETYGTNNNDVLTGGPGPSDMYGGYGRDEMYGGKGNDRVYGGYGDDVL